MARSLRQRRFSRHGDMGEDVNPSAYIVNLADCMLVLACGFMVALISLGGLDLANMNKLDDSQLEEVDPQTMPEDVTQSGSGYVEAGTVYQDPNTGQLYMVERADGSSSDASSGSSDAGSASSSDASGSAASSGSPSASSGGSGASEESIRSSRAGGAD